MSTVFVSGATGFIAQHLIKDLIAKGYIVVGSVRSQKKGEHLKKNFPQGFQYSIVEDIVQEHAFDAVLQRYPEITAFFHTASPFHYGNEDIPERLLKPAIFGTRNAMNSAKLYGRNIKRFIVTSSIAAIASTVLVKPDLPISTKLNEESWTEISWEQASTNGYRGYAASKALAEREVWRFVKEEKPSYEVAVVNPTFVFGPQAFDSEVTTVLGTSSELVNALLKIGPNDPLPQIKGRFIDVRDVSKGHIVALEKEEAAGKRIILQNGKINAAVVALIMRKNFPELREKLPKIDPESAKKTLSTSAFGELDDSRSSAILAFEKIGLEKCITDSVAQILRVSHL